MACVSPIALHFIMREEQQCRSFSGSPFSKAGPRKMRVRAPVTVSASSSSEEQQKSGHTDPPKMEPFSQSRLSRSVRDKNILEKAESALYDKCMALDGEEGYRCWEALFQYENIKEEYETECDLAPSENRAEACRPLERFENLVRQSGGSTSLIDNVRMVARVAKQKADAGEKTKPGAAPTTTAHDDEPAPKELHEWHEDGGIPKTSKEMQEDNEGLMPESPFTRVLRRRGRSASWYTQPPEHETD